MFIYGYRLRKNIKKKNLLEGWLYIGISKPQPLHYYSIEADKIAGAPLPE
jgi:hypothetical protein